LSGPPLKPLALKALRTLRAQLPASIPLIGCGGISNGADALEYARAGASLVQVYTAFGYDGAGFCRRVKDELTALLAKENTTWSAVVDKAVTELSEKKEKATLTKLIQEAEELKKLLDGFGDKLESDAVAAAAATSEETKLADTAAAAVPPVAS
jgi:dihydroorotate dehydrogenase